METSTAVSEASYAFHSAAVTTAGLLSPCTAVPDGAQGNTTTEDCSSSGSPDMSLDLWGDADGNVVLLSAAVYNDASKVMDKLMYFLQGLGLVLNVGNAAVLTRRRMRSGATSFLVALSGLQLGYVALLMVHSFYSLRTPASFTHPFYLIYGIYVSNYVLSCLRRCMLALHCLVSVERLLAVLLPLKARQSVLARRPGIFVLATLVLVFLVHVHVALKLEVFRVESPGNGTSSAGARYSYRYTSAYLTRPGLFDAASVVMKGLLVYLPLTLLAVVNVALLLVLRAYSSRRAQIMASNVDHAAQRQRETKMTVTILVSTLIFVVLGLPTASNSLVYNAFPGSYGPLSVHKHLFLFVQNLGGLCLVLAFSTDFFTYVALSSAYRNTLLRMLRVKAEADKKTTNMSKTEVTSAAGYNKGGEMSERVLQT